MSAPPISAHLWASLRRFDPGCFIGIARDGPERRAIDGPRVWRAGIRPVDTPVWQAAHAEHSDLAGCLEQIVRVGERRGWAREMDRVQQADPPISAELWARMLQLDRNCYVHLRRDAPSMHPWRNMKRTWQLLMHDQRGTAYESVRVEHPTLAETLRFAAEEAERRGWAS